jgi:hypothetical protein
VGTTRERNHAEKEEEEEDGHLWKSRRRMARSALESRQPPSVTREEERGKN